MQVLILRRYRHAVTHAVSRSPSLEIGGGILADEMGMGKSLSILALVTKTMEEAEKWAAGRNQENQEEFGASCKSIRATLVLVPSASESRNFHIIIGEY